MEALLREVKDFPREGILFQDIDPLMNDAKAFAEVIETMSKLFENDRVDLVCGPEARGYLFSSALALKLGAGVCLARKPGKLPAEKISQTYGLEYGKNTLEMHTTAVKPGQRVLLVDDLLATGGTLDAAAKLVKRLGGEVIGCCCLVELTALRGGQHLIEQGVPRVESIIKK